MGKSPRRKRQGLSVYSIVALSVIIYLCPFNVYAYIEEEPASPVLSESGGEEDVLSQTLLFVNGAAVDWSDTPGARISMGRLVVPIARLAEALGGYAVWEPETLSMFVYVQDRYLWIQDSNPAAYHGIYATDENGAKLLISINAARVSPRPDLTYGHMTAPLQLVEALGGQFFWDEFSQTAFVAGPVNAEPRKYSRGTFTTEFSADGSGEHNQRAASQALQFISVSEALAKYEADDPMILACFGGEDGGAFELIARAAEELKLKVYAVYGQDFPFAVNRNNARETRVYFINGFENVATDIAVRDYDTMYKAMVRYWAGR